ncbi:MAG: hypothetical protein JSR37_01985 [Verrucomicrobia bacterium]|nr:hypothetical protein [Verrucomicrobiota bacterium]MBS0637219.1 hypothetical protein [Verrucomicrobiota bacterium]
MNILVDPDFTMSGEIFPFEQSVVDDTKDLVELMFGLAEETQKPNKSKNK